MTEEQKSQTSAGEAWTEVGQQLRSLGENLAIAFQESWQREETRQHLEKVKTGLEAMAEEISRAVKEVASSQEAQQAKVEFEKAARSAQAVGQETLEEVRPQLLSAFRKIRVELDQIIRSMEQQQTDSETSSDENVSI